MSTHISLRGGFNSNKAKDKWITSLLNDGLEPEMFVFETVTSADGDEAETFWISYFKFVGADLLNIRGVRPMKYTPRRRKMTEKERLAMIEQDDQHRASALANAFLKLSRRDKNAVETLVKMLLPADIGE